MYSQSFSQTIVKNHVLRIEKEEELIAAIKKFCEEQKIKLGKVSGIGATDKFQLGLFDPSKKEYLAADYTHPVEIISLLGNVSTMNGETYLHLHAAMGDENNSMAGGHLNYAWISATAEVIITEIEGEVDRFFSEEIGLNLLKLNEKTK